MELRHLRTIAAVARHGSFTKAAEEHPGVAIHMVEDTQEGVLEALRADDLDCAFTALNPDALGNEFAATLLWEEEIVVALPPGHPLSAREEVTFDELATEDLIAYREHPARRRRLERAMADRGLEPRNAFICTEMGAVRGLASKGLGVAVIPRSIAEQPGPPIARRAPRPADRAAADRAGAADVADRARLARVAAADAGGQGVPQGRAR